MPTAPSSQDVARVYSTQALVAPYLKPMTIGEGAQNPVTTEAVEAFIKRFSRRIDGYLGGHGWRTPFPDVTATNPGTPEAVKEWVTLRVAAECAFLASGFNWQAGQVQQLIAAAQDVLRVSDTGELQGNLLADSFIEYVHQEEFKTEVASGSQEFGQLGGTLYARLRNRGLVVDDAHSLTFVDASGYEVFDSSGQPFGPQRGWYVESASQSVIVMTRRTELEDLATYVNYYFTWRDLDWFNGGSSPTPGTANYIA